jgi:hypothetical protein
LPHRAGAAADGVLPLVPAASYALCVHRRIASGSSNTSGGASKYGIVTSRLRTMYVNGRRPSRSNAPRVAAFALKYSLSSTMIAKMRSFR